MVVSRTCKFFRKTLIIRNVNGFPFEFSLLYMFPACVLSRKFDLSYDHDCTDRQVLIGKKHCYLIDILHNFLS